MSTGVGLRIKHRRQELGWSQEELALRVGLKSKSTICKIERGEDNMTATSVNQYADALQVTPGYLMGWEDTPEAKTVYEQLKGYYIKKDSDRKLLERYHNLSPEARKLIDLVIEDDLRKNGRPD